ARSVVIQDTPNAPKPKPVALKPKLKGVQSLTPEEQEAVDTMQSLKESKKTSRRQLVVPDEEKVKLEEKVILEWGSKQESEYSEEDQGDDEEVEWISTDEEEEKKDDTDDDKSINLEMTDDEETDDEFVQGVEEVNDDEDEEMKNAETEKVKDDAKRAELPPTSSGLSVSSGFGDQFLKLSPDTSLVSTVKDTTDAKINSLLDIKIQSEVPHI
ncbi:hypothetical protein Tco_0076494, partial [Tanacetum coccineum]